MVGEFPCTTTFIYTNLTDIILYPQLVKNDRETFAFHLATPIF